MAPKKQQSTSPRSSTVWSHDDDQCLLQARAQGMNWQQMSQKCFPGKTPNACRKRHERLREQQNLEQWDGVRFEELARAYMEVREQIWTILGDRIGEKWTVVEAKCFEKGIKNLQGAARSGSKRGHRTGGSDDSGIGLDDHADFPLELPPYEGSHRMIRPQPRLDDSRLDHRHSQGRPSIHSMLSHPGMPYG